MISRTDVYVPETRPAIAKITNAMSFHIIQFPGPSLSGHSTHISIIAGNARPKMLKQKAPKSDIKSPKRGIAAAKTTKKKKTK